MTNETKNILTNGEVIAIDQDSLGIQGFRQIGTRTASKCGSNLSREGSGLCAS